MCTYKELFNYYIYYIKTNNSISIYIMNFMSWVELIGFFRSLDFFKHSNSTNVDCKI